MTQAKPTILIVDDDLRLRQLLHDYLTQQGFLVHVAENTTKARAILRTKTIGALVLDIMMPAEDGLSFLKWLRAQSLPFRNVPVLLLTAMGESHDRIAGLESGADDYLSKPFEPRELVLRLLNMIKPRQSSSEHQYLCFGDFTYDTQQHVLKHQDAIIHLTTAEQKLLAMLLHQHGTPIARASLADALGLSLSPRSVDVQITRLRKKIEGDPKKPIFLCTLRHEGYVMRNVTTL